MHMADALLSPAVGTTLWAGTAAVTGYASKRLKRQIDDRTIPLMGVLGAFIFAAQMINFTIPGTGSSGHLGGGMILAVLLGPHAAFLVMASVLTVQALFFADGGLLALGCNIWNLGVYPCYLVYPLIYKPLVGDGKTAGRILVASVVSVALALQLGAFSVVLETLLSGKSELPFGTFLLHDAADPSGDRGCRGFRHGRRHQLRAERQTRDPRWHGGIAAPRPGGFADEGAGDVCGVGGHHRRGSLLVCLDPSRRP